MGVREAEIILQILNSTLSGEISTSKDLVPNLTKDSADLSKMIRLRSEFWLFQ